MAIRKAPKRVYLFRAAFSAASNAPTGTTLQSLLATVLAALPVANAKPNLDFTVRESALHGQLRINHQKQNGGTLELKVVALAPGEFASTVPLSLSTGAQAEGSAQAPALSAFKSGDFFMIVSGNNLLCVGDHLRIGPIETYLRSLFMDRLPNLPYAPAFGISPVARKSKIDQLEREGIKAINLNTTLYAATLDEPEDDPSGLLGALRAALGGVSDSISAVLTKEQTAQMNEFLGDVQVSLSISIHGASKGPLIAQRALQDVGMALVADDEFVDDEHMQPVLITKHGNRVSASDSTTSEVFPMNRRQNENSLNDAEAWARLRSYFGSLQQSGALDE